MPFGVNQEAATTGWARRRLPRLAAAALFLAPGPLLRASQEAPAVRTLVFFGDSLTAGYGLADPGTQSYPALIQRKIDGEHLPWRVVNAGLSGETSAGGLRRIDWVLLQKVDVFVLELGANDGLRGTSPEATRANLQAIIDRVRSRYPSARIVLEGLRMPANMGPEFSEAFRAVFPGLAEKNSLILIPFLLEGVAGKPELNQPDGMHPAAAGDAIIADYVWRFIRPVLNN
jgi:acyl-CoA thioesterase-1